MEQTKTIVFFGHSFVPQKEKVKKLLCSVVEDYIKRGYKKFLMGRYGDFDNLALNVCRQAKTKYSDILITVIVTSYAVFNKKTIIDHVEGFEDEVISYSKADKYSDVETSSYFVEDLHFKRRITETNRYMVDSGDIVICYVDQQAIQSGAKKAVDYAKKQNKFIVNIWQKEL